MVIVLLIKTLVDLQKPKLDQVVTIAHFSFSTLSWLYQSQSLWQRPCLCQIRVSLLSFRWVSLACPRVLANTEKWNLSPFWVPPGKSADHSKTLFLLIPTGHYPLPVQQPLKSLSLFLLAFFPQWKKKVFPFDFEMQISESRVFTTALVLLSN